MLRQPRQPQLEDVPEHGHVHGEAAEVVGEVALGEDALNHQDHHLDNEFEFLITKIVGDTHCYVFLVSLVSSEPCR